MAELNVIVKEEVGRISWNYAEMKAELEIKMNEYAAIEYTDETIKSAKADRADLNKLKKAVDDRRKEVKAKFMVPYNDFEAQAKELTSIIDAQAKKIDEKVKEYEARTKKAKYDAIIEYWNSKCDKVPEGIREKAFTQIYDEKWTNLTATQKAYKDGIDTGIERIVNDIATIESMGNNEFQAEGYKKYCQTLILSDAIMHMNNLQKQKEEILSKEKERLAQEAERKAEQERERIRKEEEARIREEQEMVKAEVAVETMPNSSQMRTTNSANVDGVDKHVHNIKTCQNEITKYEPHKPEVEKDHDKNMVTIQISKDDFVRVKEYFEFAEIGYKVI